MHVEIFHASKFGNGEQVAKELQKVLVSRGAEAEVHHIRDVNPKKLPSADLYVFSSPTRIGKPLRGRAVRCQVRLPAETKYAFFATHGAAA